MIYAIVFLAPIVVLLPFVLLERRRRKRERLDAYADYWAERGLRELERSGELNREIRIVRGGQPLDFPPDGAA